MDHRLQPAVGHGPGEVGREVEGLGGGQPQRAGQGPALHLLGVGVELQRLALAQFEGQGEEIAGAQHAPGVEAHGGRAPVLHGEAGVDIIDALLDGEGGLELRPGLQMIDGVGEGRRLAWRAVVLPGDRLADHLQARGGHVGDVQAAAQELGVAPADAQVVGLQPHALGVDDGQPAHGEVTPDVAPQPLQVQPAVGPDLQPFGAGLDEHPHLLGQGRDAQAQQQHAHRQQEDERHLQDPVQGRVGLEPARLPGRRLAFRRAGFGCFGRGRGAAQKLCPIDR